MARHRAAHGPALPKSRGCGAGLCGQRRGGVGLPRLAPRWGRVWGRRRAGGRGRRCGRRRCSTLAGRSRVGGKPCPADVRHPLGASAVVAVPERSSGGCSKVGAGLMSPALRASPQLTPPTSSAVAGESGARARTEARPAALRPPHPCSLADWEDREEQQCGQEARGGSHGLLQLPLHMGLLQSRSLGRLRPLEEGAWCAGWVVR